MNNSNHNKFVFDLLFTKNDKCSSNVIKIYIYIKSFLINMNKLCTNRQCIYTQYQIYNHIPFNTQISTNRSKLQFIYRMHYTSLYKFTYKHVNIAVAGNNLEHVKFFLEIGIKPTSIGANMAAVHLNLPMLTLLYNNDIKCSPKCKEKLLANYTVNMMNSHPNTYRYQHILNIFNFLIAN
jgi:hypothetical protein